MNLILISAIWGIVMMFSGLFVKDKSQAKNIAIGGALLLLIVNLLDVKGISIFHSDFGGMLSYDLFGYIFLTLVSVSLLVYFLLSGKEIQQVGNHPFEYFALIFFIRWVS